MKRALHELAIGLLAGASFMSAVLFLPAGCAHAPTPTCAQLDASVGPCVMDDGGATITCPQARLDAIVQCVYEARAESSRLAVQLDAGANCPTVAK